MEEWKKIRLGDIVEVASGFSYKGEYIGSGRSILLGMGCVSFKEKFLMSGARPYSGESPDRFHAQPGDIVLATRQQSENLPILGMPAILPDSLSGHDVIVGANLYRIINNSEIENRFLYLQLKTPHYLDYINKCKTGTTVRMITKKNIEDYVFLCPPKEVREKIVSMLWNIEDKIDLNKRINHNLEQQAQALFSHWLNNCEDKVAISELCDNILDYTPITAKRVVALNSRDVTEGVFAELSYTPISEIKGQFKKRFEKGDILYSEIRPRNLHYAYCYFNPMDYIASTRLMVIRSKSEKLYSSVMLYQYLQMPKVFEEFTSKTESRSGTFPQGNFKDLSSSIVPYSGDNEEISIILESLYKLIWKNIDENKSLSSLRDSLLPILMSGELKINDLTC